MLLNYLQNGLVRRYRLFIEKKAKKSIQNNLGLWKELENYLKKTGSTGCSFSDYLILYSYIRKYKPIEVLECSTGVSTIVMAYGMMENENDGGVAGRITSMEESIEYYTAARQLIPPQLSKYIDMVQSQKVEGHHYFFRGVKYKSVPDREYDFVFIDGPTTSAPSDGQKTFDFDFIDVVLRSEKPVSAIVDCRLSTCYVLGKVLGKDKIKYDKIRSVGYIGPCTKFDIKKTNDIIRSYKDLR